MQLSEEEVDQLVECGRTRDAEGEAREGLARGGEAVDGALHPADQRGEIDLQAGAGEEGRELLLRLIGGQALLSLPEGIT